MGGIEMSTSSPQRRKSRFIWSMTTVSSIVLLAMVISHAISQLGQFLHKKSPSVSLYSSTPIVYSRINTMGEFLERKLRKPRPCIRVAARGRQTGTEMRDWCVGCLLPDSSLHNILYKKFCSMGAIIASDPIESTSNLRKLAHLIYRSHRR
jgi:hypothetical protein